MKTYRVAVLGCGPRGGAAARAYAAHPRTQVVGLCDLAPDRARALGAALGVSALYADLDVMIPEVRPDIVVVPTGTEFHYDLARRALEYGAHVDVEKPMCATLDQADALLELARARGLRIAVHHQSRVNPSMLTVRQAIRGGQIGEIRHTVGSCKGYYGGFGLMNIGTHMVNNLMGLFGPCVALSAVIHTDRRAITPEDVLCAPLGMGIIAGERITGLLEFEDGNTATVLFHRYPQVNGNFYGFEVLGMEGHLLWKQRHVWRLPNLDFVPGSEWDRWEAVPLPNPENWDPVTDEAPDEFNYVDDFVNALDEGRDPVCSGAEGLRVMEVLMAIFESGAYQRRVTLPLTRRDHPLLRWRAEAGLPPPEPGARDYKAWLEAEDRRLRR